MAVQLTLWIWQVGDNNSYEAEIKIQNPLPRKLCDLLVDVDEGIVLVFNIL
jgi:hypothetical protein